MKRMTIVIAFALSAAAFSSAEAQVPNLQFQTPLNYRFSVMPRSHVFSYNRRTHNWHRRHHARLLPGLRGPAVIHRNGEIEFPPEQALLPPAVPTVATPVVYRFGESSGCNREQVAVPGSKGRTTVNIWRC